MNAETFLLWGLIFAVLLVLCGAINEIRYKVERWFERRTLDKSEVWEIKKRRGQIR